MKNSKPLALLCGILIALTVLSASIAAPILCRPFYYAHIDSMELEKHSGLNREQIRRSYDDMLDYCTGKTESFSVGLLPFSDSGASHFADVRRLFLLDLGVLLLAPAILLVTIFLARKKRIRPYRFCGKGPGFWAAAGLGALFLAVGLLAALDFDRAFTLFHALFFPGKDNWIFDWRTDPVILILPQEFFRNCALLILALLLLWCAVLVASDRLLLRKDQN